MVRGYTGVMPLLLSKNATVVVAVWLLGKRFLGKWLLCCGRENPEGSKKA